MAQPTQIMDTQHNPHKSSTQTYLLDEAAEERLDDAVHGAEEDAALSVDVGAVFVGQRGREGERGAEGDRPPQRNVRGLSGHVLQNPWQEIQSPNDTKTHTCLLYTSDAADE